MASLSEDPDFMGKPILDEIVDFMQNSERGVA
jgi:hypothetical protein